MIKLTNIHKSFGKEHVLKGVDLQVSGSEAVVIIGASGSGKTTLLRAINFLTPADEGEVTVGDLTLDVRHTTKAQILAMRRRTAMVFQNYNLIKNRTALENVTEGPIFVQKKTQKEAEDQAKLYLDDVGMGDKLDSYPSQLSGGQQQRVAIARALALHPEVILFDEPTSALDPELIGEVLGVMRKIAKRGITMIVVTHEMTFAQDIASQVIFLDGGLVVESGTPGEIFGHAKEERTRQFLKRIMPEYSYAI
jgi:L-cystine transport system ATP-binding protein